MRYWMDLKASGILQFVFHFLVFETRHTCFTISAFEAIDTSAGVLASTGRAGAAVLTRVTGAAALGCNITNQLQWRDRQMARSSTSPNSLYSAMKNIYSLVII